jgi:nicotinate-nucleotide--dimethylbenzimidazole phosphoribosyltransferase
MTDPIRAICAAISAPDQVSARLSMVRQLTVARPAGSLGQLDEIVHQIAAIRGRPEPDGPLRAVVSVLAGDHGVARHGTSAFRSVVTGAVLRLILAGQAPVSTLACQAGARVEAADFGLIEPVGGQRYKVAAGTGDIAREDAMPPWQASQAVLNGIAFAGDRFGDAQIVAVGELGVGNTTAAAALTARLLGLNTRAVVGTGSGIGGDALSRKLDLVGQALRRTEDVADEPLALLAALGGHEIGGNVGVILAAANSHRVVLLDGFITGVAALLATRLCPAAGGYLIAAHRSAEPGHGPLLDALGLRPVLALDMRLGMASGATLALGLIGSALAVAREIPTARAAGLAEIR